MMLKSKKLLVLFVFCVINTALSQKEIGIEEPGVKAIATVNKKTIMLRWGVNTPSAWKKANKYGFLIERKTIVSNNEILNEPIVKKLNTIPLKPKPMMEWKEFTQKNTNAAIAAQALYGDNFDVEMNNSGNGILSILNQAQVLEQRFIFAMYAADQDFEVAKFSGLAFVDTTVKEGERYLYTIKVAEAKEKSTIKHGGVYLGLSDQKQLPKPKEFVGVFKDKTVLLSWNYAIVKRFYTNYILEKSEDLGKTYTPLTSTPIANLGERDVNPSNRMMYVDSLFQNNKTYQYRIKGISPFGIEGPYSKIVSGKGITPLIHNPFITENKYLDDGTVMLQWEFPNEGLNTLKGFEIVRADEPKGRYLSINAEVNKSTRSIKLDNLQAINYYKVIAIGTDGTKRESFPKMIQPDDSTPPAIPTEITGKVDTLGVVRLNWKLNTEVDFLGYRVFRANLKEDEFTQITFKPIPINTIVDTINIKTLNKKIYYKIQAVDKRYNPSKFSNILELKRPDIVPPTQPVFSSFNVNKNKVELTWINSSSKDAKNTLLYRKERGSELPWELLATITIPNDKYTDSKTEVGKQYLYTILTVDDSGLESEPVTPLKVKISDNLPKPEINKFEAFANREEKFVNLNWKYTAKNVDEFILYRGQEGVQPTMYKIFDKSTTKFKDKDLLINTNYEYLLQAVFASGAKSPIKKIEINY
ncbi:fibronectin type III domain-containing protein [Tenacibaculum jejuense]|nr:hypothetical protein [Tenacibaculum jejuense]